MNPTWRTKSYTLHLPRSRRLIVTLRRQKSAKRRSTPAVKRLILPTLGGYARQIILEYRRPRPERRRARRRPGAARAKVRPAFRSSVVRPWVVAEAVLFIVGLAGVGYFGPQLVQGKRLEPFKTFSSSTSSVGLKKAQGIKPLSRSEPTHIAVPSVGIDADVISVGRDSDGSIATPPLFDWVTGWYKYSPTPGEIGPSVIVGHVDTYKGASVFWRLREVSRGDIINIKRKDGRTVKFKVTALKQFDQDNFPTDKVYGNLKHPGLRLITCGGAFNERTQSYTQNTVVYAFMIKS